MKLIILITVLVNTFLIIKTEERTISNRNVTEEPVFPILPTTSDMSETETDPLLTLTYDTEYPSTPPSDEEETPTSTQATYADPETDIIAEGPGLEQTPMKPIKPTKKPVNIPQRRPVRRPNKVPNHKPVQIPNRRRPNMKLPYKKNPLPHVQSSTLITYY